MVTLAIAVVVTVFALWAIYWLLAQIVVLLGSLTLFLGGGWLVARLLRGRKRSAGRA